MLKTLLYMSLENRPEFGFLSAKQSTKYNHITFAEFCGLARHGSPRICSVIVLSKVQSVDQNGEVKVAGTFVAALLRKEH